MQQAHHDQVARHGEEERQALHEQVELVKVLLQQSKEQCAALEGDNEQLRGERRDGLNRLANAKSELTRQAKHTAQVGPVLFRV